MLKKNILLKNFSFESGKNHTINDYIYSEYENGVSVGKLLKKKSSVINDLIKKSWKKNKLKKTGATLIAVGGYGREQLFPFSDIDILILIENYNDENVLKNIENFIADIWNLKTTVGHSVRTIKDCLSSMNSDVTVYTNLLDNRFITGDSSLYKKLLRNIKNDKTWSENKFLLAKKEEQKKRYNKYSNTGYLLEPNLKEGPGGFRDLQTLQWVAKRSFKTQSLADLYNSDVITKKEYLALLRSERFLSKTRFLLHHINGKPEERLYFSNQKKLSELFGYNYDSNVGVEKFMQSFYKHITNIKQLNEILIKHIENNINGHNKTDSKIIFNDFLVRNNTIRVGNNDIFIKDPGKILKIFLLRDEDNEIFDISASTIRLIRENLYLINKNFRSNNEYRKLFISIFYQTKDITKILRKMNDYGVLSAYLKPFSKIVGMMQFDLFHIYTVDEHTLSVLSNTRYMGTEDCKVSYPFVFEVFKNLLSPEILYLSAIFHDIGKGRKKNHSEVGSRESRKFCKDHGLGKHQTEMVSWLVDNHLLMSITTQKKDISDETVIKEFSDKVKTKERLEYLYLLTIADIRGTNPGLYTDWKNTLLKSLYLSSKQYFRRNIFDIKKPDRYIRNLKNSVAALLNKNVSKRDFEDICSYFNTDYFRRHSDTEIAYHIEFVLQNIKGNGVSIKNYEIKGCTQLTIYQNVRKNIFTYVANIIDNLNINIVDARIITLKGNRALDTYLLLDQKGEYIKDTHTVEFLKNKISSLLSNPDFKISKVTKKQTESISTFKNFVNIGISQKSDNLLIEINTLDHPGLLSKICESFDSCNLMIKDAKIATLGEEANDIFTVFSANKKVLLISDIEAIKHSIKVKISELYN